MFEAIDTAPPDAILGLNELFRKDSNSDKVNLTVGVYKNDLGLTPIMKCVKQAESRLLETEDSKGYLGIAGSPEYGENVCKLLLGENSPLISSGKAIAIQSPGGTGALRVAAEFIARKFPAMTIWCSRPTWANHSNIFRAAGVTVNSYNYLDDAGTGLDFEQMLEAIKTISTGQAILLHACCHNPTGVDPTVDQWKEIVKAVTERGLLPVIDCAYQGFGNGVDTDVAAIRMFAAAGVESIICSSFSKNFGLYGERTGALTILAASADAANAVTSQVKSCIRANYSNPPKHGAAIVSTVLDDEALTNEWSTELTEMRSRIHSLRDLFVTKMNERSDKDFSFIKKQVGMFSYSGLTPVQVDELRQKHAIYIVGSGRINIAGLNENNLDKVCDAIASVQ